MLFIFIKKEVKYYMKRISDKMSGLDKRNLIKLANDFLLLDKKETYKRVKNIIEVCKTHEEARRKIMSLYDEVYM